MSSETLVILRHPALLAGLGACVGSFLNVVIHRLPRKESLLRPGSRCPDCREPIRPWDNVPVISWLLLRGRCRACGERISFRYPFVELLTAVLFMAAGRFIAEPTGLAVALVFATAMIAVTFIDLDHMIIPDVITLPGTLLGLAAAFAGLVVGPLDALLGVLIGAGGLLFIATGYRAATGREGLGGGDVKLLAMVGAFLGPVGAFLTILIGSVSGTLFATWFMLRTGKGRTAELPFGTFLAPGAVVVMFVGTRIVEAYWGLFVR
jgi:leader peptidase (prepilin peptidase)/N-methyltransferase